MERIIVRIIARRDPANDLAVSFGQKKRGVAVLVKRVLVAIEKSFSFDNERRHPGRIVFVNPPRKFDESVPLGTRTNFDNR